MYTDNRLTGSRSWIYTTILKMGSAYSRTLNEGNKTAFLRGKSVEPWWALRAGLRTTSHFESMCLCQSAYLSHHRHHGCRLKCSRTVFTRMDLGTNLQLSICKAFRVHISTNRFYLFEGEIELVYSQITFVVGLSHCVWILVYCLFIITVYIGLQNSEHNLSELTTTCITHPCVEPVSRLSQRIS